MSVNSLPDHLEDLARHLGAQLRDQVQSLAEAWYEQMAATPQLISWRRPDVRAAVLPAARVDIERELVALAGGRVLPETCPDEVRRSAQLAARSGLPLWASLQAYRVGHAQQWRAWSGAVERQNLIDHDRLALLGAGSDFFFAYADCCMRWMEIEYTAARELPLRRVEQRRVQLVSRVLEGHDVDAGDLGYDLAGWHLGLVLGGSGVEEQIEQIAQAWAATVLTVAVETSTLWTWLGCSVAPGPLRDALVALSLPEGTRLAVSEPARGRIGFREAHRQAQVAAALGVERGRSVMAYADVALEDLVMRDTGAAARFAARELGSLADSGREAATLRETLTAYFHAAQRASSAAAALGVHQRTVGNRLRRIEHLLGRPVQERCVELQVALRLFVMQPQHRSTR